MGLRRALLQAMPEPWGALGALLAPVEGLKPFVAAQHGLWLQATAPRPAVGCTPHRVVHAQNKLVLRYYAPSGPAVSRVPVVIVPSLINRAYICDLEPDRSLCGGLARLGHPVYLVDWGVPGPEDAAQDVGTVLLDLLHRSIDRACRHAKQPATHMLGYCQGGTLAVMMAALRPARIASLVALNAPVRFTEGGRFARFVDPACFDVERSVAPDRLVPVEWMAAAFKMLDPMGNWTKLIALDEASHDPTRLARTLARERWLEENIPMPGAFAREFIRYAYQEDRLLAGTWAVRGEPVLLRNIKAPLMAAVCTRDSIAPAAACAPLVDAAGSTRKELVEIDAGHIGVVVGSQGPKVFYPMLDRWFRSCEAEGSA